MRGTNRPESATILSMDYVKRWGQRLLAAAIAFGLVGIFSLLLLEVWGAIAVGSWDTAVGRVTYNNEVVYITRTRHWTEFTYEYTVNGETYTNQRVFFFEMFGANTKEEWQAFLDKHPEGSELTVRHSTRWPQQSVINPQVSALHWFGLALAAVCAVLPGFAILAAIVGALWNPQK